MRPQNHPLLLICHWRAPNVLIVPPPLRPVVRGWIGPAATLVLATAGVGDAWLWRERSWAEALIPPFGVAVLGMALTWFGFYLVGRRPVAGTFFLEAQPLFVAGLVIGASALVFSKSLDIGDEKGKATSSVLLAVVGTSITAFLTKGFIENTGGAALESSLPDVYSAKFSGRFEPSDPRRPGEAKAWDAVFSDEFEALDGSARKGWGWSARRARAQMIERHANP